MYYINISEEFNVLITFYGKIHSKFQVRALGNICSGGTVVKNLQCRRHKRHRFDHLVRKIFWSRKWQPTPVCLPGKLNGPRSLVDSKKLDTPSTRAHTHNIYAHHKK